MEVSTSTQRVAASRGVMRAACALAAVALALPLGAHAQQAASAAKETVARSTVAQPLRPNPDFAHFPRYAGMLGKRQIVMRLGPQTDDPTGVHGEYQFTDTGVVILIAGDHEGTTLEAEESNDGTRITGNWVGTFAADGSIAGARMEVDDSNPVAFELKPLTAGQPVPPPSAEPAAELQDEPAEPASPSGQAVNGVSNLKIGE
ncbi:MAG: hypothetical protein EPN70_24785 [Paraburkholderia sp.]|uniref:hypothetical protein n=1 Tax=Paraburkholderia sp. TaxID=1926495 RepID=UPI001229DE1D|nr:hypothetical protein [Paraburkholderia sp.]TAL99607.1 MAG: hypothetical protein EPN70_24785 [Paraburkholderia sp.]TAM31184.1 MAG: hypothetical protein EPN59_05715 [Paraburkholderia sp.]